MSNYRKWNTIRFFALLVLILTALLVTLFFPPVLGKRDGMKFDLTKRMDSFYDTTHEQERLRKQYKINNAKWFAGTLPDKTEVVYTALAPNLIGLTTLEADGHYKIHVSNHYILSRPASDEILFHETCHIVTWDEWADHGPEWTKCMLDLAQRGAMEGVW